jgi:hypothetical protein
VDAVESLAQDETLAQLLELKSGGPIYVEREEREYGCITIVCTSN